MHFIQKHILDFLRVREKANYTDLMLDGVESGHFRYHLKELEKAGLVESSSRGVYQLTPAGKSRMDELSEGKVNPDKMPKVITYTLLHDDENVYLYKKPKEPYLDTLNLVGGKLHRGEDTVEASRRELIEKLDYQAEEAKVCGVFASKIYSGELLYTHSIAYVCSVEVSNTPKGTVAIAKSDIDDADDLAPDAIDMIKAAIQSEQQPFNLEKSYTI